MPSSARKTGGRDPIVCHGHTKGDAAKMKEAVEKKLQERVTAGIDVADLCRNMAILASGKVILSGHPLELMKKLEGRIWKKFVNVEELESECVSAPMGGGNLFQARATVLVPPAVSIGELRADLERIAADVMVDLKLSPTQP